MGGGGSGGGMVVGGPTPDASLLAGQYQAQAAQAAANAATTQTNAAINLIRDQYNNAFMSLKPYTMEGIQALNELNSYMGLQAYDPGTAPTSPVMKTYQDYMSKVKSSDIMNYIQANTALDARANDGGQTFLHPYYMGSGVNPNDPNDLSGMQGYFAGGDVGPNSTAGAPGVYANADISTGNLGGMAGYAGTSALLGNPDVKRAAQMAVARQMADQANADFDTRMQAYNQQMDVYNYAKQQHDNYAGPLTAEQVTEKLMNQPGVAFQYSQGLDAIQRAASAKGMAGSGRLLQSLVDYGQGVAQQQYGATLSRLAGLASMGQQSASQQAQNFTNLGNTAGSLTAGLGDTIANSYLASGNAMAQSILSGNQQYQVIGGGGGGGGLAGIGSVLGGLGSLMGSGGLFG